jgi:hypothetical protein
MLGRIDDNQLLALVEASIEENLKNQKHVKESIEKADRLWNAIIYVERLRNDLKSSESSAPDPIYFEKYSKKPRQEWIYYKFLYKASEHLAMNNDDEVSQIEPNFEIDNRNNRASNFLTTDMGEYSEFSNSSSGYKQRQRHQLSQKFKTKNKYKFKHAEDQELIHALKEDETNKIQSRNIILHSFYSYEKTCFSRTTKTNRTVQKILRA